MPDTWRICIDTGGTFTDCLARDPEGGLHHAKVLSSATLRGRVVETRDGGRRLVIDAPWSTLDGQVDGFTLRALEARDAAQEPTRVGRVEPEGSRDSEDRPGRGDPSAQDSHPDAHTDTLPPAFVVASGPGWIDLDRPLRPVPAPGAAFEVASPEPAPLLAARLVTRTPALAPLPPVAMRLATTWGTNALLERRGAPTALFITEGFGDLLLIGDQQRPDLFALRIVKPAPLNEAVVEVPERLDEAGGVLRPLDLAAVEAAATELRRRGIEAAAVALLHSYRNPAHERQVAALLRRLGFAHVAVSADLAPLVKILPRAHTAVVDAYLGPVVAAHLGAVSRGLAGRRLHAMTSAGGLVSSAVFRAKDSLLSGPAGGVAGAADAGRRAGFERLIAFDMGGTSTDVARFDGVFEYRFEHRVDGLRVMAPALAIETVAAGGGSICRYHEGRLRVGPESAGAVPGPACYGAGGPLTLTDVNLLLGRLDPARFEIPIFAERAEAALDDVCAAVGRATGTRPSPGDVLDGLLAINDERMAGAIAEVSIRRGYDPGDHALVAFGGAGGQHACALADRLGLRTILFPPGASLLSAAGLDRAVVERFAQRQVLRRLDEIDRDLPDLLSALGAEAAAAVVAEGAAEEDVTVRRRILNLRLEGQETTLAIDVSARPHGSAGSNPADPGTARIARTGDPSAQDSLSAGSNRREPGTARIARMGDPSAQDSLTPAPAPDTPAPAVAVADLFRRRYLAIYGHEPSGKPIEVESMRVVASTAPPPPDPRAPAPEPFDAVPASTICARWGTGGEPGAGGVPAFERSALTPGARLRGPALVFERHTSVVIAAGWEVEADADGCLVARRADTTPAPAPASPPASLPGSASLSAPPDVVRQELFAHRLTSIAREMGEMLQRTAISTNVKERLDFSCAVLDPAGELVVNAPHIPVHLGALGVCVRALRERIDMRDGDVVVTNHPAFGGSHLPDVTVVQPVFAGDGALLGYAANRAHHAEIGGTRPGSMPPGARCLAEEGVVLTPMHLVRGGRPRYDEIERRLRAGPFPTRSFEDNLADLRAQVAAARHGAEALCAIARTVPPDEVRRRMRALADRAEQVTRETLRAQPDGVYEAVETMDDGAAIRVAVTVRGDRAVIDFRGSAPTHPGNLNATPAIVRSAVIYVLRLLIGAAGREVPLNEGIMRVVDVRLERGMLDPAFTDDPATSPAVVGGNVETSQRIVDTLLAALGLCAGSQGTMNNVLFGSASFGYYETVCGGSGAGPGFDGADGVHTHMTNTRATDPEVLEHRYPVRLEAFALRRGSGGPGSHPGGAGVVRAYRFLAPLELSILSQHRREGPRGLAGGGRGAPGAQRLIRADGSAVDLGACDGCGVGPGDRLVLMTPGGGGYGRAEIDRA